ncbi:P1 family peptidase [Phenylobacterium sp.]|uniref:P1 family peptidase n=1 Tax=Phenylobacterium sp. TaxID=1871053 RepID=UPI0035AF0531
MLPLPRPGRRNLITDVAGLRVGHADDSNAGTGVTTLLCDDFFNAGVDVRGGGPGVRETETLAAENLVGRAHAIVLSGGSVFGLGAADGVVAGLSVRGVGLHLKPGSPAIPIVPAAVLHDLANPGDKDWGLEPPYRRLGLASLDAAEQDFALGSAGAGRGAMAGLIKGGVGSASIDLGDGLIVAALVVANPVGSVLMPDGKTFWAWPFEIDGEFGGGRPDPSVSAIAPVPDEARLASLGRLQAGAATTIGAVATTADLSTAECKRVAMMAHDGLARAVRPAHMPFDGDTLFSLATGACALGHDDDRPTRLAAIGSAAADCVARAIARGVYEALKQA